MKKLLVTCKSVVELCLPNMLTENLLPVQNSKLEADVNGFLTLLLLTHQM